MCHNFRVSKIFMLKRVMSRFLSNFLSHKADKLRRGTRLCCVSENFVVKTLRLRGGGGGIKVFRRKFFVSQYRNISKRNPSMLCFRKSLVAKKFMDKRAVGVSRFSVKNFLSHSSKKIVGERFSVSLISGIEKFYASEGYVTIFRRFFLSHSTGTFRGGTLLCCVSENLW